MKPGEGDVFSHVVSVKDFSSFVQVIVGSAKLPFQAADPTICICKDVQVGSGPSKLESADFIASPKRDFGI